MAKFKTVTITHVGGDGTVDYGEAQNGFAVVGVGTFTGTPPGNAATVTLTFTDGVNTISETFACNTVVTGAGTFSWSVADPDLGATLLTYGFDNVSALYGTPNNHVTSAPFTFDYVATCFMPGTMIATPGGEVAVETLSRGDLVLTSDGRSAPVSWMGRQSVARIFADAEDVVPIRIRKGALGENAPVRDLLISPDHAILVDGALVQAGALVNGVSIVRETGVAPNFTYFHLELEDHSLILAEGVAAETFIDNVARRAFDNWAEHEALYPNGKPIVEMAYPRAKAHRQVARATRERLTLRAAELFGTAVATAA